MSNKVINSIVVIPIGPTCKLEYVRDTVESITHFMPNSPIILVDDSQTGTGKKVVKAGVEVVEIEKNNGKDAGLYLSLSEGFKRALDLYEFKVLLRIDTDGLIAGYGADIDAINFARKNPKVGIFGSHLTGYTGGLRDFSWADNRVRLEASYRSLFSSRASIARMNAFRKLLTEGLANGYIHGEQVMGGACFYTYDCLIDMRKDGFLPLQELRGSKLQEDMIFGLIARNLGYKLMDFIGDDSPMGVKWQGLPDSPENLLLAKKKIIHSTRYWEDLNEDQIREIFRRERTKAKI